VCDLGIVDRDPGVRQASTAYVFGRIIGCTGRQAGATINIADV
jgi:hypothetical protein